MMEMATVKAFARIMNAGSTNAHWTNIRRCTGGPVNDDLYDGPRGPASILRPDEEFLCTILFSAPCSISMSRINYATSVC